jgi:uncharacterized protein (DUF58 family)
MATTSLNSLDSASTKARQSWPGAEVWIKFLLAMLGLGLAFGAALFSTASGEAGHLWVSVILASVALLTAAFVGLVTVPYLARRVALERLRQTLHYEVTKAGVVYVLVALIIGIAALNTGNNLLYIVVAAMLAAILVSGIVSALILRGLELEVRLPDHVFAGRPVKGRILLRNSRWALPSFSIRVVTARKEKTPRKQWHWEPTTFAFPLNRTPENQWLRLRDWRVRRVHIAPPAPGIFEGMVYFPYVPANTELAADLDLLFDRRGRYQESGFGVATRFPFAFLTKTRQLPLQREILVYPPIEPTDEVLQILPLIRGEWESFIRGRGSSLYRIREYMPEDSARHVDWKATAKSGSLKVREFTREDERKLCIIFDNPPAGLMSEAAYERGVTLAASLAWHFSSQNLEISFIGPSLNSTDLYEFLSLLAVIQPEGGAQQPQTQLDAAPEPRNKPSPARAATEREGPPRRWHETDSAKGISPARDGTSVSQTHPSSHKGQLDALSGIEERDPTEYQIVLTARPKENLPAGLTNSCYFLFLAGETKRPSSSLNRSRRGGRAAL